MSQSDLIRAFSDRKISRRAFLAGMVAAGASVAAATSYANALSPRRPSADLVPAGRYGRYGDYGDYGDYGGGPGHPGPLPPHVPGDLGGLVKWARRFIRRAIGRSGRPPHLRW